MQVGPNIFSQMTQTERKSYLGLRLLNGTSSWVAQASNSTFLADRDYFSSSTTQDAQYVATNEADNAQAVMASSELQAGPGQQQDQISWMAALPTVWQQGGAYGVVAERRCYAAWSNNSAGPPG
jgi:hypothetical protein